jgi:hypothetical protein
LAAGLLLDGCGELMLLLSYPYPRWHLLLGRWLALTSGLLLAIVMGSLPLLFWVGWRQGWALIAGDALILILWGVSWTNAALCLGIWRWQAHLARWAAWLGMLLVWAGLLTGKLLGGETLVWSLAIGAGMALVGSFWLFGRRDVGSG